MRPPRTEDETLSDPGEVCRCGDDAIYTREVSAEYTHEFGVSTAVEWFPLCADHLDWEPSDHDIAEIIQEHYDLAGHTETYDIWKNK